MPTRLVPKEVLIRGTKVDTIRAEELGNLYATSYSSTTGFGFLARRSFRN